MMEKTNANGAGGTEGVRTCARAQELIAYLYGESAPAEAEDFRRHLAGCAACGEELAAFGSVREGLGAWREEVMRSVPPLNIREALASKVSGEANAAEVEANAAEVNVETNGSPRHFTPARERSAAAALREFFTLSPVWLRVGAAAALVAFCAMTALTLTRAQVRWDSNGLAFTTGVQERVVEREHPAPAASGFTREQVDALVREKVETALNEDRARRDAQATDGGQVVNAVAPLRQGPASRETKSVARKVGRRDTRGAARGEQLADNADDFYAGEESVPRLIDILGAVKTPGKTNEQ
jgi:anti-sigma factor RsiW